MNFNVQASAYDQYMGRWSEQLSAQLADFAQVMAGHHVIDVGCGPGNLTRELSSRVGAESVKSVDPSPPFVEAARARNPGVDVRLASAEALPFPDGAFDTALAQLVVHFMPDPIAGIAEMARVTRSGGVVAACVWDFGGSRGPLGPFWEIAHSLDPNAADESLLPGTREGHLAQLFEAAGIADIEEASLPAQRAYESFAEWWEPFTLGVGPGGVYVSALEPRRQAALRERCRLALPSGSFVITAFAWATRGSPARDL